MTNVGRLSMIVCFMLANGCEPTAAPTSSVPSASPEKTASSKSTSVKTTAPSVKKSERPSSPVNKGKRDDRHDDSCEGGAKAYVGSAGDFPKNCTGPTMVDFTTVDPKTGESHDAHYPIWCCP